MEEPLADTIMEEREDYMVSLNGGGKPILRTAHFLKPSVTVTSIDEEESALFKLPSDCLSSAAAISKPGKLPLKVAYHGWRNPLQNWESWFKRLVPRYESTWKRAGVYDAIMVSMYRIQKNNDLVLGVAQKWCCETKSFIFSWGEATISLEDLMILGGYSVLGDSVLLPLETQELKEIEERLNETRLQIGRTAAKKASQHSWMRHFMEEDGRELEHEAFLSLWLSRFVFPNSVDVIRQSVFPIAIHLARGTRIALAPAVLASIYGDLSLLKAAIVASTSNKFKKQESVLALTLWAPLQFVQIWIWERFITLSPKPDLIEQDKPRVARWHMKDLPGDVRLHFNSLGECFQWRPYTLTLRNWSFPKFYREVEEWVTVKPDLDVEFESFARCVRVSELVGIDCIEKYLPHRVAMQFGLDQDLPPGHVARCNESPEAAWNNYSRPIIDASLYIPSRLFESDVTSRYAKGWKKAVILQRRLKTTKRLQEGLKKKKGANDASVALGFSPKKGEVERTNSVEEDDLTLGELLQSSRLKRRLKERKGKNDASSDPAGCPPKLIRVDMEGSIKKSKRAIGKKMKFSKKQISVDKAGDGKCLFDAQFKIGSSSTADNEVVGELELTMKPADKIMDSGVSMVGSDGATKGSNSSKKLLESSKEKKGDNYANVPPENLPELNSVDVENSIKDNELQHGEMLKFSEKAVGVDKAGDDKCLSDAQSKSPSTLTADNGVVRDMKSPMKPTNEIRHIEVSSGESDGCDGELEIPGLELEARINKLGKVIAMLKAERDRRFGINFIKGSSSGL